MSTIATALVAVVVFLEEWPTPATIPVEGGAKVFGLSMFSLDRKKAGETRNAVLFIDVSAQRAYLYSLFFPTLGRSLRNPREVSAETSRGLGCIPPEGWGVKLPKSPRGSPEVSVETSRGLPAGVRNLSAIRNRL